MNCFPLDTEPNLVDMICDFAESRSIEYFTEKYKDFSKELLEWGHIELTGTLSAEFIPISARFNLLTRLLGINKDLVDPIENYHLIQLLNEL